jgi:predicted ATPase
MSTLTDNLTFAQQRISHEQMTRRCVKLFSVIGASFSIMGAVLFF